ncbi:YtpR family tRNA-binding protein [Lactococcus cremoris]|uniref:YtpR family tRNA-binding protein n=1 Tax=Lactococcus lactis subsp. cremoris TaxID=1359 RepID=UPI000C7B255D
MIATYNTNVGDVLMLITANDRGEKVNFERKGKVARIFIEETGATVAWNIFEAKSLLTDLSGNGQVKLSSDDVEILNKELGKSGFSDVLVHDLQPKFVVAEIVEMQDHPDSDHLHICKVNVGFADPVQIVCGAPNASLGLKTVAALPGAMMPNGALIFPGALRGVQSYGMLCSARELELPDAPDVRGIIELSSALAAGTAFDSETMWQA